MLVTSGYNLARLNLKAEGHLNFKWSVYEEY